MIEVVRDTVGRHDTFNLACTSKYYEDMGYMGHINCTDNFNNRLDKLIMLHLLMSLGQDQGIMFCLGL